MHRGLRQLLHKNAPRARLMWAILKAFLFFRVVIFGAIEFATLEDPSTNFPNVFFFLATSTFFLATSTFFLATSTSTWLRAAVTARDGWWTSVNGKSLASAKLVYSKSSEVSPSLLGFGIYIGIGNSITCWYTDGGIRTTLKRLSLKALQSQSCMSGF